MKLIFAGTPKFAAVLLDALLKSKHNVVGVLTQPDKPSGRGQKAASSEAKQLALDHHVEVLQPATLKTPEIQSEISAMHADLMVVAVYGLLLPKAVLTLPRLGCLNVHASLLPRWRGASPLHQAILAGDEITGITLMKMDEGLDTGDMLVTQSLPIGSEDTTASLSDKLATLGADLLVSFLDDCEKQRLDTLTGIPQINEEATHAPKILKSDACIDFSKPAAQIEREIRAYQPWPISYSQIGDMIVRFWKAEVIEVTHAAPPGTILNISPKGVDIATGTHTLRASVLQLPGKKPLPFQAILNGHTTLFAPGRAFVIASGSR